MRTLYRCPVCGEIVNERDINEATEYGGMPYCNCRFIIWDKHGEPIFTREYIEYVEIGIDLTDELEDENLVMRP